MEKTSYGEVLAKNSDKSSVYVNGMKVAEEGNFLFSYNITSLTKDISKALNRERVNVGRSAYSGRVKQILLSSVNEDVVNALIKER
ncbi:unnamed protein product [marine sediment metagenome]|uniref:MPN635 N-terminal domain-containing protein n=1 Tax=marine sediment metagenome TaxID=412755 RepID=X1D3Z6_9ZZZZ